MAELISTFKKRFSKAMSIKGITPTELKDKTGISLATISQYTSGYSKPKTERTNLIANALSVDPAWLMGFDVPMERVTHISDEDIGNVFANDDLFKIIDNISALSSQEKNHFHKYLQLLEINRKKADNYVEQLLSIQQMDRDLQVDAAHEDNATEEQKIHADNIMADDSEWE